jgi:hypothetical protein
VHDETGRLRPLNAEQREVLRKIEGLSKSVFSFARHNPWRRNLARGLPNEWHCGAGGRHLYICENGLVHYCMAQRGYPAIPLAQYTRADIERETKVKKDCAPFCTIFCIQRVAFVDKLREHPKEALTQLFATEDGQSRIPIPIRLLTTGLLRKAAARVLNID